MSTRRGLRPALARAGAAAVCSILEPAGRRREGRELVRRAGDPHRPRHRSGTGKVLRGRRGGVPQSLHRARAPRRPGGVRPSARARPRGERPDALHSRRRGRDSGAQRRCVLPLQSLRREYAASRGLHRRAGGAQRRAGEARRRSHPLVARPRTRRHLRAALRWLWRRPAGGLWASTRRERASESAVPLAEDALAALRSLDAPGGATPAAAA